MVRVRFAPSPTGYLHIGSLRAALFNWLFAKHNNGKFLIRIEDTDLERSRPEYVNSILESLNWASINSSEPIIYQSNRLDIYKKIVNQMLDNKTAYRCFCTAEELEERLTAIEDYKKYDEKCRNLEYSEQDLTKPYTIRFKLPKNIDQVYFKDLIRGDLVFEINQFDDFIIFRSDKTPTYNFAVVVDDYKMAITHVLRGEDHISNTPKQILLYKACGFNIPEFGHFPLILGSDGSKLSKRHAATSVDTYRQTGYLADALCNYLVRLGWSHGDQEIFTRQELIDYFNLDQVGKSGAIFDLIKLEWVNSVYIRNSSSQDLLKYITQDVEPDFLSKLNNWDKNKILKLIDLYKERVKTLSELVKEIYLLYFSDFNFENINFENIKLDLFNLKTINNLDKLIFVLEEEKNFSYDNLSVKIKELCKNLNIRLPEIAQPVRIALTGKISSPGVFELLALLAKSESIKRIKNFRDFLFKRVEKH